MCFVERERMLCPSIPNYEKTRCPIVDYAPDRLVPIRNTDEFR